MIELFKEEELVKSGLSREALLVKFKEQLIRDFEMCNANSYLLEINETNYDSLHANLRQALERIMSAGSSVYQQLLYRIDVSEKQFADALAHSGTVNHNDVLADLIIKRILQKVILKVIYSK